jgi:hypothetical protein
VRDELAGRCGEPPEPVLNPLEVARLRMPYLISSDFRLLHDRG